MKLPFSKLHSTLGAVLMMAAAAGCAEGPNLGETRSASTVADYASSGCSTSVVLGLSAQIAQEAACVNPDSFVPFEQGNGISITSSAVLPYLVKGARDDLQAEASKSPIQINSALRTIAQQYLLYHWYLQGRCGITAAAHVGNSNHEGGRAVDLANWSDRLQSMPAHGWKHDVPGDVVHFDHTASADDRGQDVEAFQRLWNANNPNDQIAEDGSYGPQTETRLKKAPATGFAIGPSCGTTSHAQTGAVSGPDRVMGGTIAHYSFTVQNQSETDWPDTTTIAVAGGQASPLYDAATWTSPTIIGSIGQTVAAGEMVDVELDVAAPVVTADTPMAQPLTLSDGGNVVGTLNLGMTVTATPDASGSSSDDSEPDPSEPVSGGCNAGGGGGLLLLLAPALVLLRRKKK